MRPNTIWSVAEKNDDGEWQWQEIFSQIGAGADMLETHMEQPRAYFRHQLCDQPQALPHGRPSSLRKAARHGRRCERISGWDGNPPQLQPLFQDDQFTKIYEQYLVDIADGVTSSVNFVVSKDAEDLECSSMTGPASATSCSPSTASSVFRVDTHENEEVIAGPESSGEEEGTEADGGAGRQPRSRTAWLRGLWTNGGAHRCGPRWARSMLL